ncbi:DNA methyltransferase (plasmid) [Lactiplantibacillus plantarum]|nr:DNA methyltransferase [Lactiplantibacillus plantarum]
MFDDQEVFSFPKPLDLIQGIIENANDKNMIVLDAFSGSGTTFDAVMRQNIKDGETVGLSYCNFLRIWTKLLSMQTVRRRK